MNASMDTRRRITPGSCAACSGASCDLTSLGQFEDASGKVGRVEVLRCRACGHGVTMPPLPDVAFLYAGRESQDYQPDSHGLSAFIKDLAFRQQGQRLLEQLPQTPTSIFDFGCGSGQFTQVLSSLLPSADVKGSDFHDLPPSGLGTVDYVPMDRLSEEAQRHDLVMAMHVLEHDDDTARLLSQVVALAKPGGTVVIEVPHIDCVWARILGKKWDAWYVPFHRVHFSRSSLQQVVEASGLELLSLHDVTVPTMGRSLANCFGQKNNLFWLLAGIALHPVQWIGEKVSGQPSSIRVIARKAS